MKTHLLALLTALAISAGPATAENLTDALEVVRSTYQADRQALLADALRLTGSESAAFWPLYKSYRADLDKLGDELVKLVLEYADVYPNVPEARAKQMLKEYTALEQKLTAKRAWYFKRAGKILSGAKALRWAQLENRMDLVLRLQLASTVPLTPIEGRLRGNATGAAIVLEGVPGGVIVETLQVTATVAAIEKASRKLTLLSPDGIKQTVKAGPDVINFDQIRVGDQLKLTLTEQLVVQMGDSSATDGTVAVVVLAPKGAKPGGLMAETVQVTATVASIDRDKRTATLRFEDGTTKTLPVRRDVDLNHRKVGEQVVFRVTEMVALNVEKP